MIVSPVGCIELKDRESRFRPVRDPGARLPALLTGSVLTMLLLRGLAGLTRSQPDLTRLDWLALAGALLWSAGAALTPVIGIWAGIGGSAIGLGIATLLLVGRAVLPLLRPSARRLAWGFAATAVMVTVTYGLYPLARRELPWLGPGVRALYGTFRAGGPFWLRLGLLPFIIASEELVWRGVVLEALRRRASVPMAVLLCSAIYAAAHAPARSLMLTAIALICGLFWSALRLRTGSLIPGLISHLIWDLLVFAFRPLA